MTWAHLRLGRISLSRLVGRGRALEILLGAADLDGPRAELYGYVNRAVPDGIAQAKACVDQVTPPPDSEFPPALPAFFESAGRPGTQARLARLDELGLNRDSDLERRLGARVVEATPNA
jgi:enoyl-CoA hydratase/carnithine racemase